MPDFWGGYLITPDTVEFWQSGGNRLHDRLRYKRCGEAWDIERLSPLSPEGGAHQPPGPRAYRSSLPSYLYFLRGRVTFV